MKNVLVSIERQPGEIRYARDSEGSWCKVALLVAWLVVWSVGGYIAILHLYSSTDLALVAFLLVFLLGWVAGWLYAAFGLIWVLFGKETVIANSVVMTKISQIGPFRHTRHFQADKIKLLRWTDTHTVVLAGENSTVSSSITFNYGAKTITFFDGISNTEANELINEMAEALKLASFSLGVEKGPVGK